MQFHRYAGGALSAVLFTSPTLAHAQTPDDIAAIRHDMETMRQDYETRMHTLEDRLAHAEADAAAAHQEAARAQAAASAQTAQAAPGADPNAPLPDPNAPLAVADASPPPAAAAPSSQNAFNPGIAAVLNGFYAASSHDHTGAGIAGFATGAEIDGPPRGFSLGESEVSFAANIDPFLAGFLDFSLNDDSEVSLEEGYIRTTGLPNGFTVKAGRFLSAIGYLNERHAHDWSFEDAPLPYRAFLNTQLGDDGVQVRWLAPTDQYLELGGEVFRGEAFPASGSSHEGTGSFALFAKTGSDLGISSSYLAGLSYLHTSADDRVTGAGDVFQGDTDLGIATLVYKWAPKGNPTSRNLILSSELFYGRDEGAFNTINFSQAHWGWYAQGVYQFMPQWSAGLRASGLSSDDPGALLAGSTLDDGGHSPLELSALLEMDTSEFGRFRLEYTHDEAIADPNDSLTLQYTVIYGPHGAHRY